MRTTSPELTVLRLLELVKAALHGTAPDENRFADTSETDWDELFEQSVNQGVMVLSLEGAMQLPKELQPPLALKMRWIASVEAVEKRYRHQLETAEDLSSRFRENGIKMMLFKGIALSRLYPIPASREFGDIDIFLCGKSKEGDAILEQLTKHKQGASKKNVNYSYRGILIENHHTFLYHTYYKCFFNSEYLEKQLLMMLTDAGILDNNNQGTASTENDSLLFPPPEFNALYVLLHMLSHLPWKIVLRHLCDLTILFKTYSGKIDFLQYKRALSESKLTKVADAFISLMVRYLGLNPEDAPPYESDILLEDRLWTDMFNPKVPILQVHNRTFFTVIINNIRLIWSNHWKYRLIYHEKLWKKIINYIVSRLFRQKMKLF